MNFYSDEKHEMKTECRKWNRWIKNKTKTIDAAEQEATLKWRWASHNERLHDQQWNSQIENCRPYQEKILQG